MAFVFSAIFSMVTIARAADGGASAANNCIAWDAAEKSIAATSGQVSAKFVFAFTNIATDKMVRVTNNICTTNYTVVKNRSFWKVVSGDSYSAVPELVTNAHVTLYIYQGTAPSVKILSVTPSEGCKVENLPAQPWVISPGGRGEVQASVNLVGESGDVLKTVLVTTDQGQTELKLHVHLPAAPTKEVVIHPGATEQNGASWAFDQNEGTDVPDTSGNGHNAKIVGESPSWVKSTVPGGSGLKLDGTTFAEVPNPVVNTAESFTVSAWVNLNSIEAKKYQTFVSIDGRFFSGFYLQMNPYAGGGTGRFEFDRMTSDSKSGTKAAAKAKASISTNTWYHLVGVYDATAQNMSLYLNGKLQDTVPYTGNWQAKGKTAIGRGRSSGRNVNYMTGTIRDVRVYGFALTAPEVESME